MKNRSRFFKVMLEAWDVPPSKVCSTSDNLSLCTSNSPRLNFVRIPPLLLLTIFVENCLLSLLLLLAGAGERAAVCLNSHPPWGGRLKSKHPWEPIMHNSRPHIHSFWSTTLNVSKKKMDFLHFLTTHFWIGNGHYNPSPSPLQEKLKTPEQCFIVPLTPPKILASETTHP